MEFSVKIIILILTLNEYGIEERLLLNGVPIMSLWLQQSARFKLMFTELMHF